MKIVTISCNECGAALESPMKAKFITCSYCSSRLKVVHSGGASYSEVLESMNQRTEQIADDVEKLRLEGELERVDREWMMQKEGFKVHDKNGRSSIPTETGTVIITVFIVIFGIFWMGLTASMAAPGFFPLFGLVFIAIGIFNGKSSLTKAKKYKSGRAQYRRKRREIYNRLHQK